MPLTSRRVIGSVFLRGLTASSSPPYRIPVVGVLDHDGDDLSRVAGTELDELPVDHEAAADVHLADTGLGQVPTSTLSAIACMRWSSSRSTTVRPAKGNPIWNLPVVDGHVAIPPNPAATRWPDVPFP
ncbi:hypothetical protein [Streptomyces sp. HC307]|uniref:hypothetical protein n=1 Tax=Streptomyces flavusporus TaxID=3385496 RepID=UPI0039175148